MKKLLHAIFTLSLFIWGQHSFAQTTTTLNPSQDNSIYQNQTGNSAGVGRLYSGRNCNNSPRRALLQFDLSSIPSNATINSVTLTVNVNNVSRNAVANTYNLHSITKSWGEGSSNPGGGGGNGATAVAPDATWNDAMLGTSSWSTAGGDFENTSLSSLNFSANTGTFTFPTSPEFVNQIQNWLASPANNFGLILIGDESTSCTSRRFGSKDQGVAPVLTINWIVCAPTSSSFAVAACESYTVPSGDETYTTSGTVMDTIPNTCGLDSVMSIELTINNATTGTDVQTACDAFDWIDGNTYTANNTTATHIIPNAAGCDSVITLNLTINASTSSTDVQTACDSFDWIDGNTYTSSNTTATHIIPNAIGCDSVITLNLTINTSTSSTDVQTACETFTWIDGNTYTSSNTTATHIIPNAAGCDSVITLDLTIDPVEVTVSNSSNGLIADVTGATYQWLDCNNNSAPISGATSQEFTATEGSFAVVVTQNGCVDTSACVTISSLEDELFRDVFVAPNPIQELVSIQLGTLKEASVLVYDLNGQLVYERRNILSNTHQFNLKAPQGIYIVEISSQGLKKQYKLVKQ